MNRRSSPRKKSRRTRKATVRAKKINLKTKLKKVNTKVKMTETMTLSTWKNLKMKTPILKLTPRIQARSYPRRLRKIKTNPMKSPLKTKKIVKRLFLHIIA